MNDQKKSSDLFTIDNVETLRLLTDPLRMRLLNSFAEAGSAAMTVKQLAARLEVRPTRLYYHVNLLEEHGLLRVASSRVVSGIIEKSYVLAARSITVDPQLLKVSAAGREAASATLTSLMQTTALEIAEALETAVVEPEASRRQMRIGKSSARLSPEAHAEFIKRLNELVDEFEETYGEPGDPAPNHSLFVAYYPLPSTEGTDK